MCARLRRQLPSNIFVQFLAGPREARRGAMGFMLRCIALISLVLGPIALLVFVQLQFLPFHNEVISWWQRIAVVTDLALLWMLWPSIIHVEAVGRVPNPLRHVKAFGWVLVSLLPVLLVFTVATFSGEWLEALFSPDHEFLGSIQPYKPLSVIGKEFMTNLVHARGKQTFFDLRQMLVAGNVDPAERKQTSLWSNRLVLPNSI